MRSRTASVPHLGLQSLPHLCFQLKLRECVLVDAANDADSLYRRGITVTRRGKERTVNKPLGVLRLVQRRILRLLRRVTIHTSIVGGIPGRDNISNAKQHVNRRFVACMDVSRFFQSIHHGRVYHWFVAVGCSPDIARMLTRLVTLDGCIPHGAITSTAVAALVSHRLAVRLAGFAAKRRLHFTQYIDDFTFSGDHLSPRDMDRAKIIVEHEGFKVQDAKTKLYQPDTEQVVTGVRVDHGIDVPSQYFVAVMNDVDAMAVRAANGERVGPGELRRIRGQIAYVRRLNARKARKLELRRRDIVRL